MQNPKQSSRIFFVNNQAVTRQEYLAFVATEGIGSHFGQSAEDAILLRLFNGKLNGFYIDVGAFHPRVYSNTYLLHRYFGWHGINIDASSDTIELFGIERPGDINLHIGIAEKAGEAVLHQFDRPARNTLSDATVARQLQKGDTEQIGEETVKIAPLSSVLAKNLPANQIIDYMNVDVEGLDLEALKSNDWEKYRPRVITVEDYEVLATDFSNSQIFQFLSKVGYRLCSHAFDTSFYIDGDVDLKQLTASKNNDEKNFVKRQFQPEPMIDNRLRALIEVTADDFPSDLNTDDLKKYERLTADLETRNKTRALELAELTDTLKKLRQQNSELIDEAEKAEQLHYEVLHSVAWQKTQPIRELVDRFRGRIH